MLFRLKLRALYDHKAKDESQLSFSKVCTFLFLVFSYLFTSKVCNHELPNTLLLINTITHYKEDIPGEANVESSDSYSLPF